LYIAATALFVHRRRRRRRRLLLSTAAALVCVVIVVVIVVIHHCLRPLPLPPPLSTARSSSASRAAANCQHSGLLLFGPIVFAAVYRPMAAANMDGGDCENKAQNRGFFMSQKKNKSCHQYEGPVIQVVIVEPFHHPSALLHLFGRVIGRGAVGHLWVVNVHCVSPDHYTLSD
jgi:hypothetical protein